MKKVKKMFNIYGYDGGNYAGNVYNIDGIAPTITRVGGGGNRMPMILVEDEDKKVRKSKSEL